MIPFLEELFASNDFIFIQDSAPSPRAKRKVQRLLKEILTSQFVGNFDWPPNSPDCKSLDCFFREKVQQKVYDERHCKSYPSIPELNEKIIEVWDECAKDLHAIRKE